MLERISCALAVAAVASCGTSASEACGNALSVTSAVNASSAPCYDGGAVLGFDATICDTVMGSNACSSADRSSLATGSLIEAACVQSLSACSLADGGAFAWSQAYSVCVATAVADAGSVGSGCADALYDAGVFSESGG